MGAQIREEFTDQRNMKGIMAFKLGNLFIRQKEKETWRAREGPTK
jgi:hypothetical protein